MAFQPEVFGKYYLVDRIAVGGMAEIFKAKVFGPGGFEKTLVIKRILLHLSQNEDFVDMFMDEARITSTLNHSNIIPIYDFGKIEDNYFIAMELLEGPDLKTLMKKCQRSGRPLPVEYAVYLVHEMCKALDHAHHKKDSQNRDLNILHRDISPSNVLLSFDEAKVKLADFGIAKAEGATYKTQVGVLKGKFEYMSPEQASGRKMDCRSDLFAAGIVMYELLTRRRLFKAGNDLETLEMIRNPKVPPPSHLNPEIPPELDVICMKALAASPEDRYQEAWELQRDLRAFMRPNSPDLIAQSLSRFTKEIFQKEIAEERQRLERGSMLIREAIKAGTMAEEIALDDNFALPDDSSFSNPGTQITFTVMAKAPQDKRRIWVLLVMLAVLSAGAGVVYFQSQGGDVSGSASTSVLPQERGAAPAAIGTLIIGTTPSNAQIYLEDKLIGNRSPLTYRNAPLGKAFYLKAEAAGYVPRTELVYLPVDNPLKTVELILEAEAKEVAPPPKLVPAPVEEPAPEKAPGVASVSESAPSAPIESAKATVDFVSIPRGAQVYIDGIRQCRTPCLKELSNVGSSAKIAFQLAGYELFEQQVALESGGRETVTAQLQKAQMGKVSVRLREPVPVQLYIDGLRIGYGVMFNGISVTAGRHTIRLKNPSQNRDKTLTVDVAAGKEVELEDITFD